MLRMQEIAFRVSNFKHFLGSMSPHTCLCYPPLISNANRANLDAQNAGNSISGFKFQTFSAEYVPTHVAIAIPL